MKGIGLVLLVSLIQAVAFADNDDHDNNGHHHNHDDDSALTTQVNNNTTSINNLNTQVTNVQAQGASNSQQISDLGNQMHKMEQTKIMPELDLRLYDAKRFSISAYDAYDATNGHNFALGAKLQIKIGKSYEEKLLDKQNKQLEAQKEEIRELKRLVDNLKANRYK